MRSLFPVALLLLASCGPKPTTVDDYYTRPLTLPGGQTLQVEAMYDNVDLLRGLMYRNSLPPGHGMLFVYPHPDHYYTVMYNIRMPLDIIWMDSHRNIVKIDENAPPCKTVASKCPKYGGKDILSSYALEIPAGMARKYRLETGQSLGF